MAFVNRTTENEKKIVNLNSDAVLRKLGDISLREFEPDLILEISSNTFLLEKVKSSKQIKLFEGFGISSTDRRE